VAAGGVGNGLPSRSRASSATGSCDTGFANSACGFGLLLLSPPGHGRTAITLMPSGASAWGAELLAQHSGRVAAIGQG
jgi:hypothetical protein